MPFLPTAANLSDSKQDLVSAPPKPLPLSEEATFFPVCSDSASETWTVATHRAGMLVSCDHKQHVAHAFGKSSSGKSELRLEKQAS